MSDSVRAGRGGARRGARAHRGTRARSGTRDRSFRRAATAARDDHDSDAQTAERPWGGHRYNILNYYTPVLNKLVTSVEPKALAGSRQSIRGAAASVCLLICGIAFAGCGSTKNAATTAFVTSSSPPPAPRTGGPPVKSVSYSVKLGPSDRRGRGHGSGQAVISINPNGELCWHFSQLKNVEEPTTAAIVGKTRVGVISSPLGAEGYTASGCLTDRPALLLNLLETERRKLYVLAEGTVHPERGLRGRL
jgi:hypothetical protein